MTVQRPRTAHPLAQSTPPPTPNTHTHIHTQICDLEGSHSLVILGEKTIVSLAPSLQGGAGEPQLSQRIKLQWFQQPQEASRHVCFNI